MIIGIPKEIKPQENRVSCTPNGVKALVSQGHKVLVEKNAGIGSGFIDEVYKKAGASMVDTAEEVFSDSDLIVKVKEPLKAEFDLLKPGQILFTYLHLAAAPELTKILVEKEVFAIAYETIVSDTGQLPLLQPMSEIAGKMSIQQGCRALEKINGGKGILLGGVPGVRRAKVDILGAGVVGLNATKIAVGMGADVSVYDINLDRLRYFDDIFGSSIKTIYSSKESISDALPNCDLLIGGVLIPGARAPHLVSKEMISLMQPGSVIVDVSVDQGGCIETCKPTTHSEPTYIVSDVVHSCIANIPGAVAYTSTLALTNATFPYLLTLVNKGKDGFLKSTEGTRLGINVSEGKIRHSAVAESFSELPFGAL